MRRSAFHGFVRGWAGRFAAWLGTARVPVVAVLVGVALSAVLLVSACVMLSRTERLRSDLGSVAGVWAPPLPEPAALRAYPAAMQRVVGWDPEAVPRACAVVDDPWPAGFPMTDPTAAPGSAAVASPEPGLLVCDGSNPVTLPSVAWERAAWREAGGSALAFRPAGPPCELTQRTADVWGPSVSAVLTCVGQRPVRVPAGGEGTVATALYRDLAERWMLSDRSGGVR